MITGDSQPPLTDWLWGPHSFISNEYWAPSAGVKWPERKAEHSPPSSAESYYHHIMEWMIVNSTQLHGMFTSLGVQVGDTYTVNSDCLLILHEILEKLFLEDRTLRTFRRALAFSQVIKKNLLPLLINAHDSRIIDATIKILVNLTMPVECLLPVDTKSNTNVGHRTMFELSQLLVSGKEAFVDSQSTRAVTDYMKQVLDKEDKITQSECQSMNSCLLLLRNVLHIPEDRVLSPSGSAHYSKQNQILWNLFTQSVDKILIQLMTCPQKSYWSVTLVQLIALMYKDQHISTLQKLLNLWFEASLSESSEDNESNTSPPDQSSGDSSPVLTSDPTSDSSDTGSSNKDSCNVEYRASGSEGNSGKQHVAWTVSHSESSKVNGKSMSEVQRKYQSGCSMTRRSGSGRNSSKKQSDAESGILSLHSQASTSHGRVQSRNWQTDFPSSSEISDCGYATQMENQESISTSSNDDEGPHTKRTTKPVHQKPHNMQKLRYVATPNVLLQDKKEWRRKKLVKRSKTTRMNMKALLHHTPSDEDISNLLKEFTVDFLLKGYGSLVQELHHQLLSSKDNVHIDTSHFFWLITYFLKFAAQLELELDHIRPVLLYDILSYLTFEGVNLCEQLELAMQQQGSDLKPYLRRLHLVVTAIREFIQAVDNYKKITHLSMEDREHLLELQLQIGATEDLKCLFVLLIRQYNPRIQNKQYLQDLIITNHILLLFLDNVIKLPEYKGNTNLMDHIKQFATVEMMHQYGLVLEDFQNNGEFINDCVFTMMHHVGGDLEEPSALLQPNILNTFSQIWEMDFELCDDWSDLIEYVIHKFISTQRVTSMSPQSGPVGSKRKEPLELSGECENCSAERSKRDSDIFYSYYVQSCECPDPVGRVLQLFAKSGVTTLTRIGVIQQLFMQDIISQNMYDDLMKVEMVKCAEGQNGCNELGYEARTVRMINTELVLMDFNKLIAGTSTAVEWSKKPPDRIEVLRDHLIKEGKGKHITWLQRILVEACYVKLNYEKCCVSKKMAAMEPVPQLYTLMKQSIPLVPWNSEQKNILLYQPFIMLLHKLGFHLPVDSGKIFARIPNFWTPDVLFSVAQKLGPIDSSSLKFDIRLLTSNEESVTNLDTGTVESSVMGGGIFAVPHSKQATSTIQFTPLPHSPLTWTQLITQSRNVSSTCALPQPLLSSTPTVTQPSPPSKPEILIEICSSGESAHRGLERDDIAATLNKVVGAPVLSEAETVTDEHSLCETLEDSVSSELTRMCVSDEESSVMLNLSSDSSVCRKDMDVT